MLAQLKEQEVEQLREKLEKKSEAVIALRREG